MLRFPINCILKVGVKLGGRLVLVINGESTTPTPLHPAFLGDSVKLQTSPWNGPFIPAWPCLTPSPAPFVLGLKRCYNFSCLPWISTSKEISRNLARFAVTIDWRGLCGIRGVAPSGHCSYLGQHGVTQESLEYNMSWMTPFLLIRPEMLMLV